ncbi:MAG: hypothetical protein ACLFRT_15285 [Actinomycetota bacterium]
MIDLVLPATDAGVAVQAAIVLVLGTGAVFATRRRREWMLVAVGLTLVTLGFFGLRALH